MSHTTLAAGLDRPAAGRAVFARAAAALGAVTEGVAALLVLVEIVVLSAGVTARYAFHRPIPWSDELATALFLWLSMFGAVIALRRGEHMRMTALINALPERWRARLDALGWAIGAVLLIAILTVARDHIEDEWGVMTPALHLSNGLRGSAIAVGAALMLLISVTRLLERATVLQALGALSLIAGCGAAFWLAEPALLAMGNANLLVFFVALVALCVAIGAPIAFAFGISTFAYLSFATTAPLTIVVSRMDEGMSELILLSVPLFVFLGLLIEMTGMARALIDFMASLLGHVRGGLAYVLLGAMYLVSGISGSKVADMAAVAPVLFPEMRRRNSHPGELVSLLASSGAMSETIPPSLVLITIGSVTGVSIAALFTGGLLPAAIGALALVAIVHFRSRNEDLRGVTRAPARHVLRTLVIALPALVLPFLIRAAVVEGVATATEVATIGIAYTMVAGLVVYRQFEWRRLYPMLVATASLSGAILLIIGMATGMAWALTQSGFSQQLAAAMSGVPGGALGFLAVSIVAFAVLGSVLEGIPAIVLFGPLLFPAAKALGIHDVHYSMVVILAMGLGLFAPPFGVGYYAACAIGGVSPDEAMRRVWPYLAALLVATVIVAAFPWLSIGFL